MASLVYFVCWLKHAELRPARGRAVLLNQLQIHEAKWAYCSAGATSGHSWETVEPLSIVDVKLYERHRKETNG